MDYGEELSPEPSVEPPRKLACDSCRRKKLKCEWDNEHVCNRCVARNIRCIPHVPQRRRKERKANTYLSSLEDRLQKMEAAMLRSASTMTPSKSIATDSDQRAIQDQFSALQIKNDGSTVFIGASSGAAIISPSGLKWIAEVTGSNDFAEIVGRMFDPHVQTSKLDLNAWAHLAERERAQLPSKRRAGALLDSFFQEGFNLVFPLFDENEVRLRFLRDYPVDHEQDPVWYAALNLIFAVSEIMAGKIDSPRGSTDSPASSTQSTSKIIDVEEASWWKWFRNGASKLLDLQFMEGSLLAVQTLIMISFVLQTFQDPYPSLVVVTSALRLAQSQGLHRSLPYFHLSPAAFEQRRNIFWSAFVLERQLLVRVGRPSIIHEDDIGIDLPQGEGIAGGHGHLRRMTQLCLIQGKIYNSLYSSKSLARSRLERLQIAGLLDEELQSWKHQIPEAIRPGNDIAFVDARVQISAIMLHLTYYNALTMIHRLCCHDDAAINKEDENLKQQLEEMNLNPRVFSAVEICVNTARCVIDLLDRYSQAINMFEINVIRVVAYYPLIASMTLFASVLRQPLHPQSLSDIQRMKGVTSLLSGYFRPGQDVEYTAVIQTFSEINQLAENFVLKAQNAKSNEVRGSVDVNATNTRTSTFAREESVFDASASTSGNSFETSQSSSPSNVIPFTSLNNEVLDTPMASSSKDNNLLQNQNVVQSSHPDLVNPAYDSFGGFHPGFDFGDANAVSLDSNWGTQGDLLLPPDLFIPDDSGWFFPMPTNATSGVETWQVPTQTAEYDNAHEHGRMQ